MENSDLYYIKTFKGAPSRLSMCGRLEKIGQLLVQIECYVAANHSWFIHRCSLQKEIIYKGWGSYPILV